MASKLVMLALLQLIAVVITASAVGRLMYGDVSIDGAVWPDYVVYLCMCVAFAILIYRYGKPKKGGER